MSANEKHKEDEPSDQFVGAEAGAPEDEKVANMSSTDEQVSTTEWLMRKLKIQFGLASGDDKPNQVLQEVSFDGIVNYIKSGKCKNIITMAGAGISTSAGIPDFRSPGSGLYDNLQRYNLPNPQAIFEISFFRENPEPFFQLAKELLPGVFKPTPCHYFIRLLHEKGLLLRHFTQNIDTLERVAGLDGEKIVEAHGSLHMSHCIECQTEYTQEWTKERILQDKIPKCTKDECAGTVKPDIVFFGEALPPIFQTRVLEDIPKCDLLIIMGTSLVVQPFASLANRVPEETPRLYINLEKAEGSDDPIMALFGMGHGFKFDDEENFRDVFWQGTCDDGCHKLAEEIGWGDELCQMIKQEHKKIDEELPKSSVSGSATPVVKDTGYQESTKKDGTSGKL